AVQHHEAHALVVGVVDGVVEVVVTGAVARAGELPVPETRQVPAAVLVVAGGRDVVHRGGRGSDGVVPLGPLGVGVGVVDQVARVHGEFGVGRGGVGGPDGGGGARRDVVLHVAQVEEGERLGGGRGGGERGPVAPGGSVADPVAVGRAGRQTGEGGGVVAAVARGAGAAALDGGGGSAGGGAVLHPGGGDAGGGAPGDGLGGGGGGGGGEGDALGEAGGGRGGRGRGGGSRAEGGGTEEGEETDTDGEARAEGRGRHRRLPSGRRWTVRTVGCPDGFVP